MNKLILGLIALALVSCNNDWEDAYMPTESTVEDYVDAWVLDAIHVGGFTSEEANDIVDSIEFRFEELKDGYLGLAFPPIKLIKINSNYWKGNTKNQNTVYHEIGHILGLNHDDYEVKIMHSHGNGSTWMMDVDKYFELIKERKQ